ncbi:hypothetical protein KEJ45_03735 [Candidatus Bathyarchaeota archaeon]|nr:hypothetical protein [Candidatus Bathyarchaeota archaeon]
MVKTKRELIIPVSIITIVSAMLGFCYTVHPSSAFAPTAEANPRIIYWPPTEVWRYGDFFNINRGWINARSIVWSPSGKYLLIFGEIQHTNYGSANTLIIDMENGTPAHIFNLDAEVGYERCSQFAFSPDETKIFYVSFSYSDWLPQIFSVDLDGSNPTFITYMNSTTGTSIRKPYLIDVTSNGLLIYSSCEATYNVTSGQYNYTSYLWKYNLTSNEKSLVLKLEGFDNVITSLKVSPLNDKIAYAVGNEVWTVDINGTEPPVSVTSASIKKVVTSIDFTPNGTMLTYSEIIANITDFGISYQSYDPSFSGNITAVNLDGSNKRVILNDAYGLAWSPINDSLAAYIRFIPPDSWCGYPYIIDFNMPITPNPDSDGDGLPDADELRNFLNPIDPTDLNKDYDEDGLTNLEEIIYGTYMGTTDFDHDGLSDGVEVKVFRTDPTKADTDGDGISDGLEAAATGLNAFISVLPEGWIRMQLQWSNKTMYVSTNSSVLGVVFNSTSMALSISVGGQDGTRGVANITIPVEMINSLSAVKVTLDNQPIDFQISQTGGYAQIYVQYHHSYHELTAHLSSSGVGIGGVDLTGLMSYWWIILSVAIVAVASVIAAIIVKRG